MRDCDGHQMCKNADFNFKSYYYFISYYIICVKRCNSFNYTLCNIYPTYSLRYIVTIKYIIQTTKSFTAPTILSAINNNVFV